MKSSEPYISGPIRFYFWIFLAIQREGSAHFRTTSSLFIQSVSSAPGSSIWIQWSHTLISRVVAFSIGSPYTSRHPTQCYGHSSPIYYCFDSLLWVACLRLKYRSSVRQSEQHSRLLIRAKLMNCHSFWRRWKYKTFNKLAWSLVHLFGVG